jgi:hypothetical protein
MNELQLLTDVTKMLASIKTVKDVKDLRDKAEAVRQYYKASKQGLEAQNQAAFVKLMCERRGGELLLDVERAQGDKSGNKGLRVMLTQSGLPEPTARRWQYLAQYPEANLREMVAICNEDQDELTTTRVVMEAREYLDRLQSRKGKTDASESDPDEQNDEKSGGQTEDSGPADDPRPRRTKRATTSPARIDAEALRTLLELFGQANNICKCYPQLASMGATLNRWMANLGKRKGEIGNGQ